MLNSNLLLGVMVYPNPVRCIMTRLSKGINDPVALICGEEAKLEGKPLNRALRDGDGDIYDIVAGKFFICGLGDENFASLPKELQQKYEEKFRQPEAFLKMGSKIMAIPTEPAKAAGKGKTAPVTER